MKQENLKGLFDYWLRICVCALPVALCVLLFEFALWTAGENWSIKYVVHFQKKHPQALFLRGFFDQSFARYKMLSLEANHPRVVAIGSSRVMKFGSEMFGSRSGEFYNAGGLVQNLADLEMFSEMMEEPQIEILILGLDMWWFNKNIFNSASINNYTHEYAFDADQHIVVFRKMLLKHTGTLISAITDSLRGRWVGDFIGVQARTFEKGFRRDGMMKTTIAPFSSEQEWVYVDRESPTVPERIRSTSGQFTDSQGFSDDHGARLMKVLMRFKEQGVFVIGFAPPMSRESVALLEASPIQRPLWDEYRRRLPIIFQEAGFPYFDASTPETLGLDDRYMVDGFHAEEMFHVILWHRMLQNPVVQQRFPDASPVLEKAMQNPRSNFWHPYYN